MSLYRTWRPRSFTDLVGQDTVVRTLSTALTTGKLAHAYIFSGPRGSGKTSAAKILARCIECVHGPTPEPDNTCENCVAILNGSAMDVIEIDAASNRGIEEIRSLRENVKFAPASMRMKVFIIDEAHMLTKDGSNAFLKTLEEPPAHVVFILATTEPEKLLPTVLSRCQRYAFRRIPVDVMIARMREIAAAEGIAIDGSALGAIAYRADGGLRDALTMLEQVASFAGAGVVDAKTVDAAFGITGREHARALVRSLLALDAPQALRTIDTASDAGADMLGLIRGTIGEYRDLLVARLDPALLSRDLAVPDAEAAVALAASVSQPKIVRGLRLLGDALAAGRLAGNPRLELETAVLRVVMQAEDPTLDALAARVAELEAGASHGAPKVARAATRIEAAPGPATTNSGRASTASPHLAATAAPDLTPEADEPPRRIASPDSQPDARDAASPSEKPPIAAEPAAVREPDPREAARAAAGALARRESPATNRPKDDERSSRESAPATPPPQPTTPPPTLQQIRSLWGQIRLRAEERAKPLRGPLSRATVDALDGNHLTIGVVDRLQADIMRGRAAILEEALAEVLHVPLRVSFTTRGTEQRAESAGAGDGEIDLMAYARKTFGEMRPS